MQYTVYSASCVERSGAQDEKIYLHFLRSVSINFLENTRIFELTSDHFTTGINTGFRIDFDRVKNDFFARTKDMNSNNVQDFRIFFENFQGNNINEVLLFS